MDFAAVLAQLNDLPSTFKRGGAPYTQFVDSVAAQLTRYTSGADAVVQQLTFTNAQDGWLDTWGLLFDIPRKSSEANPQYSARISTTLLAWVGTLPALQAWLNLFAPGGSVANVSGLGYVITLPPSLSTAQITAFFQTFIRIRPAGVPFTVNQTALALYLSTINFFGEGRTGGSYLSSALTVLANSSAASTNNAAPQLPDLYFVDPTLNPTLV